MIYCSQCGTQNRDGSKFCSNCAARLAPPSGLICPMCSTANPVETVFCNNCGARLVPLTGGPDANRQDQSPPIKGLSLPARSAPPSSDDAESDEPATKEKIEDWLAKLRAEPPTEEDERAPFPEKFSPPLPVSEPAPPEPPPPAWFKPAVAEETAPEDFISPEDQNKVESLPTSPESREQLPNWLKEMGAQTRLPEAAVEPEPSAPMRQTFESNEQLPEWLQAETKEKIEPDELPIEQPVPLERDEAPAPLAEEPAASLVPFERDEEPAALPEESVPQPIVALEPIEPVKPEDIPTWVAQLKPSEDQATTFAQSEPMDQAVTDTAEISDWLRTPTAEIEHAAIAPEVVGADVEMEGPLANLRGVLPLAIAMAEPHVVTPLVPTERKDGAHLFDEILAAPQVETARPARRRVRRGIPSMRAVIYFLIALAVIVPFFVPLNVSSSLPQITGTRAAEFYDTIQALPADSTVLVSFDYDPSVSGEMDLLANAIVRHLVQRRVKIIALSTLETGPMIAQRVLVSATANASDYRYGTQYLNLGFLPGHESGLAQLANQGLPLTGRDFGQNQVVSQYPIVANVKTVGSLAMVIELAGTEEPLKNWLEQFQPRVNAKIAAGASAAVEPKARAYRDAKQLIALVSGPVGAAQYEILANQSGTAVTRLAAQSAVQIVLIAVVIIGNIAYWVARLSERKK